MKTPPKPWSGLGAWASYLRSYTLLRTALRNADARPGRELAPDLPYGRLKLLLSRGQASGFGLQICEVIPSCVRHYVHQQVVYFRHPRTYLLGLAAPRGHLNRPEATHYVFNV